MAMDARVHVITRRRHSRKHLYGGVRRGVRGAEPEAFVVAFRDAAHAHWLSERLSATPVLLDGAPPPLHGASAAGPMRLLTPCGPPSCASVSRDWTVDAVEFGELIFSYPIDHNLGVVIVEAPVELSGNIAAWSVVECLPAKYDVEAWRHARMSPHRSPPLGHAQRADGTDAPRSPPGRPPP